MTRAERKAKHAEANKQLWDSADNPETFHFVETRNEVPLKSDYKPALMVLSRKPKPEIVPRANVEEGVTCMSLQDDEDDSEEEARKERDRTMGERQSRAQQEREEKQRKYAEVRERLFGSPGAATESASGRSSPMKEPSNSRLRGGGGRGTRGRTTGSARDSRSASSADQSPARPTSQPQQLYGSDFTIMPNSVFIQKREADGSPSRGGTPKESPLVRQPHGPDGSGRGGNGFATRGNRTNMT